MCGSCDCVGVFNEMYVYDNILYKMYLAICNGNSSRLLYLHAQTLNPKNKIIKIYKDLAYVGTRDGYVDYGLSLFVRKRFFIYHLGLVLETRADKVSLISNEYCCNVIGAVEKSDT